MTDFSLDLGDEPKQLQERIMRMTERHELRKVQDNKRRRERYEYGSQAQQTEVFTEMFKEHKRNIEKELNNASEASIAGETRAQLTIRMDNIFKIIESLKKYMTESSMFLTAFDNEQTRNDFQTIMNNFNKVRDSVLPQKKFGFGAKVKRTSEKPSEDIVKEPSIKPSLNYKNTLDQLGFVNETGKELRLSNNQVSNQDLCLSNLKDCRVILLPGSPGSIYVRNLNNCTVISGPISRSLFAEDCQNCQFYLACQQARIHNTNESDFYLHLTSSAVTIENCSKLRFAPYMIIYDKLDVDFESSGLDRQINNWNKVDDFRHLAAGVASPNWCVIPEEERKIIDDISC